MIVFTKDEAKALVRARRILDRVNGLDLARKDKEDHLHAVNAGKVEEAAKTAADAVFNALNTASSHLHCENSKAHLRDR